MEGGTWQEGFRIELCGYASSNYFAQPKNACNHDVGLENKFSCNVLQNWNVEAFMRLVPSIYLVIIEFCFRTIWRILQISEGVIHLVDNTFLDLQAEFFISHESRIQ